LFHAAESKTVKRGAGEKISHCCDVDKPRNLAKSVTVE
jgi:hypothetical protein